MLSYFNYTFLKKLEFSKFLLEFQVMNCSVWVWPNLNFNCICCLYYANKENKLKQEKDITTKEILHFWYQDN